MNYLLGIDEAGYGPNLGPLVVSASVWQVLDGTHADHLYQRLASVVTPHVPRAGQDDGRLLIADSKLVYSSGDLQRLERGVLSAVALLNKHPADWREVWLALEPCPTDAAHHQLPWHCDFQLPLPVSADPLDLARLALKLPAEFSAAGVQLIALRSRTVFPSEFNRLVEELGNKGAALSQVTLKLAADVLTEFCDGPTQAICDKHGGRNRYGSLLQQLYPDTLVEVAGECSRESIYRWGPPARRSEMRFCVGAERFMPVALASMASKYLREVCMRAFNDFWQRRIPGLRPTAGYPLDARRFQAEIQATQIAAGIDERCLWRCR